ncbi:MAG: hypothetical protein HRT61_16680 [Ekhidna sp.]|nr:hypothetical protein [Ekhidna sp.]
MKITLIQMQRFRVVNVTLENDYPDLESAESGKKEENLQHMHRVIVMLKAWLRCTHHSVIHLQGYFDEYCYRFNRHPKKEGIFGNMMNRMVPHALVFCKKVTIA